MAVGDSLADPFLWVDNSGTTENGTTTVPVPIKYYRVHLQSGITYTIETINPSNYDTFLYLYDTLAKGQALLATDDDGGVGTLSKIIFTPRLDGSYFIGIGGFATSVGNFRVSVTPEIIEIHRIRYNNVFQIFDPVVHFRRSNNVFEVLQVRSMQSNNLFQSFQVRRRITNNTFSIFDVKRFQNNNVFDAIQVRSTTGGSDQFRVWSKKGYEIFANGTFIGFLPDGVFTLTDIPLADGDYDITVKPLGNFYRDVNVQQSLKINTDSGGAGVTELLPDINDLITVIDNARTYIGWNILPQYISNTTKIGLWFGATAGINITGVPNVSIPISELLTFRYSFQQVINQWVAVATYDGADRGTPSEIELVWSNTPLDPPDYQHIEEL